MFETLHTLGIGTVFTRTDNDMITHITFTDWHNRVFTHELADPTFSPEYAINIAAGACIGAVLNLNTKDGKVL